ncbi:MAG: reactive oxygen species modulator 1 [Monoraphidium minutum]|nr:MAG: reactive oxygen species modulator 1 [Monoraphidium minutum]
MVDGEECAKRVAMGFGVGAALGSSIGAVYGTYGAFKYRVPGVFKIRYVGQNTVNTGLLFGVFLAAGSLLQCYR